jgi:hypothetical protein
MICSKIGEMSSYIEIEGLLVDIDSIQRIRYSCEPNRFCDCHKACCSLYEVTLTKKEIGKIDAIMDMICSYVPSLRSVKGYDNVFDVADGSLYSIDKNDDGLCAFSYLSTEGCVRCAIHTVAIEHGLRPEDFKPRVCSIWPLSLVDLERRKKAITVDESSSSFGCVGKNQKASTIHVSIRKILLGVFGSTFYSHLESKLAQG